MIFDQSDISDDYRANWKATISVEENRYNDDPSPEGFIAWLAKNSYIEDLPAINWHVGSYGEFEPVIQ